MEKTLAVSAALIPFIIAAIVTVFGIYKRRKAKCNNITWVFPIVIFMFFAFFQSSYFATITITNAVTKTGILSPAFVFVGNLIMIFAYYVAVQPSEYNNNFYVALFPLSIGELIDAIGLISMVVIS